MSYDVVVTERVGETSVETKFKNYKDYIDYTERKDGVGCSNTKLEITGEVLLTLSNIEDIIKVGDTVIIKDMGDKNQGDFKLNTEYLIIGIDFNDKELPIQLDEPKYAEWVDFTDPKLEIYKVIK